MRLSSSSADLKESKAQVKDNNKRIKEYQKRYKANAKDIDKEFKTELRDTKKHLKAAQKAKDSAQEKTYLDQITKIEGKITDLKELGIGYSEELDGFVNEINKIESLNIPLLAQQESIETKLVRHTELTNELKRCKATVAEIKLKKDALVEKAREKITPEEAKVLILERWKDTLHATVMDYVNRYERELITELENRYTKYCITLTSILASRENAAKQLDHFLIELGYEG